jgi:hypothetical protein
VASTLAHRLGAALAEAPVLSVTAAGSRLRMMRVGVIADSAGTIHRRGDER